MAIVILLMLVLALIILCLFMEAKIGDSIGKSIDDLSDAIDSADARIEILRERMVEIQDKMATFGLDLPDLEGREDDNNESYKENNDNRYGDDDDDSSDAPTYTGGDDIRK